MTSAVVYSMPKPERIRIATSRDMCDFLVFAISYEVFKGMENERQPSSGILNKNDMLAAHHDDDVRT